MKKQYEYRHIVSFEETNLVGNVYFSNLVKWQGRCREFFLRDHCPGVLSAISGKQLALITLNCSCEFIAELEAFDEVIVAMELKGATGNRINMAFTYYKVTAGGRSVVAKGTNDVGCFSRVNGEVHPIPVPQEMLDELEHYSTREILSIN